VLYRQSLSGVVEGDASQDVRWDRVTGNVPEMKLFGKKVTMVFTTKGKFTQKQVHQVRKMFSANVATQLSRACYFNYLKSSPPKVHLQDPSRSNKVQKRGYLQTPAPPEKYAVVIHAAK
jgi:hypothetical protein